ncbi:MULTISPECIES: hypothetical protein [unclassified Burkholderia]|uniref:hypothetical protein n=1 Tax=unclassified Burkholderia TaxID=2613784 RepID=UPI000F565297|nr:MULTISPECIES: hypothetical protein [unclassified Burkholderia]
MMQFTQSGPWTTLPLEFGNLPRTTQVRPPQQVPVSAALREIESYVKNGRAITDFFFAVISHFESFLSAALAAKAQSTDGTLGQLMARAKQGYAIPTSPETEMADEVRERRNMLVHHRGVAQQRYVSVASVTSLPSHIRSTALGQVLAIDDSYFAYVCDGLITYARLF